MKHIILAAALCAALGTCGLAEVNAAEEVWNGHEEVTVIKGKILRTETVKKADHHKKIQKRIYIWRQIVKKQRKKKKQKEKKELPQRKRQSLLQKKKPKPPLMKQP